MTDQPMSERDKAWKLFLETPKGGTLFDLYFAGWQAAMQQERATAIRVSRPEGNTFDEWRENVRKTALYQKGDTILLWINEGDYWAGLMDGRLSNQEALTPAVALCATPAQQSDSDDETLIDWEQVARAQSAKLSVLLNEPGALEKLKTAFATVGKKAESYAD
jgi:hypothetical protein